METVCSQSLKWTLSAGCGAAVDKRTRSTLCKISTSDTEMLLMRALCWDYSVWARGGFDVTLLRCFCPSCLEMASDVSSLNAAVSSGNPGPGAQAGGAIVQRANKRRPGWVCTPWVAFLILCWMRVKCAFEETLLSWRAVELVMRELVYF